MPSTETFSSDQVALRRAIEDIKATWACQKHGVCFINKDATHVELNCFRLGAFGAAVVGLLFPMIIIFTDLFQVAGQCLASGPPPAELLQAWVGPTRLSTSVAKVPRGRSGPGHSSSDGPSATPDATNLLLSTVVPMVTMLAHNMTSAMQKPSRRRHSPPSSLPPSSPPHPSSPPPAIEDELDLFLKAFGHSKGISDDHIEFVSDRLKAVQYSPDAISESSLSVECLRELTGLAEGQLYALRKFSREWCGKIELKRAKLTHRNK